MQILPALLIAYPRIDPVLIEIGPFALRWYALAYVAGILLGWWYAVRLVRTERLWRAWGAPPATPPQVDDFILWVTLGIDPAPDRYAEGAPFAHCADEGRVLRADFGGFKGWLDLSCRD